MYFFSPFNFNVMQKPLIPAFLFACLMIVSCGKSTDTPENVDRWVVSHYNNSQIGSDLGDDTALFTGYTFEFNAGNELIINLPDGSTKTAKWGADAANKLFVIGMENPTPTLEYLMGDWEILLQDATKIKLERDIIDAAIYTPELEFEKL